MGLVSHVALVPDGVQISGSELTTVASALSKQVQRDFSPIWEIDATVDAFATLEDVPTDYWKIIVMRNVQGAEGYHDDKNGQPFAVVNYDATWHLTASHECLEMLADPFGRRTVAGDMLEQAVQLGVPHGRVNYLVEVCDPSEGGQFGYQVNGVQVSDFYTPQFFDPTASAGVRYSFTGAIDAPRKVLKDGYISFQDLTSGHWLQLRMFPDQFSSEVPHVLDLTTNTNLAELMRTQSLRSAIDRLTDPPAYESSIQGNLLKAARVGTDTARQARAAAAASLREQVKLLTAAQSSDGGKPSRRRRK